MTLDELLRYKALNLKYVSSNRGLLDLIANDQVEHNVPLKNVCAMVHPSLFDDLTSICGLLDISKREFIESALVEALGKAHDIIEQEKVIEYINDTPAAGE